MAAFGQPAHGGAVDGEGPVRVALAGVHRGPGGGVDDHVGADGRDGPQHLAAVGDVQLLAGERDHLVAGGVADAQQVGGQLAAGAGDQQPHQNAARAFSGSHHQRLSRYHSTVAARPSSSECSAFQPSAVTFSWVIE